MLSPILELQRGSSSEQQRQEVTQKNLNIITLNNLSQYANLQKHDNVCSSPKTKENGSYDI